MLQVDKPEHTAVDVAQRVYEEGLGRESQEEIPVAFGANTTVFAWFFQGFNFVLRDSSFICGHSIAISKQKNV